MRNYLQQHNSPRETDFSVEAFTKDPKLGFPDNRFLLSRLRNNGGFVIDNNGHQFFTLENLLKMEKTMNRPKRSTRHCISQRSD